MAVVRLLGISKVASQYIGEVGGEGENISYSKILENLLSFYFIFFEKSSLPVSASAITMVPPVRAALAFLVLWSFNIFKKAVRKR